MEHGATDRKNPFNVNTIESAGEENLYKVIKFSNFNSRVLGSNWAEINDELVN